MSENGKAARAASFINSIGINVHMEYTNGAYANVTNVISDLAYLGITNIRDQLPQAGSSSIPIQNEATALNTMAADGIKFDLGIYTTDVQADIASLNAMETADPGSIIAVEGPNEVNNFPVSYNGATGVAAGTPQ
jgi:hypothetical protein